MGYVAWLGMSIIFTIIEFIIPTLVTVWFAFASLLTVIISFLFDNLQIDLVFFTIVSIISILFIRPYVKKSLSNKKDKFDATVIETPIKIEKIININNEEKIYEVRYKGASWTGLSKDLFKVGDIPKIEKFEGNKIIIKK